MKTPTTLAPDKLDFAALIRAGETVGWAEATAEPVLLTRMLGEQAARCPPFRVFFALTFASDFPSDLPNVTVTACGGAGAGRRFFADGAGNGDPDQHFGAVRSDRGGAAADRCRAAAGDRP